jgi:hypothetical protein
LHETRFPSSLFELGASLFELRRDTSSLSKKDLTQRRQGAKKTRDALFLLPAFSLHL